MPSQKLNQDHPHNSFRSLFELKELPGFKLSFGRLFLQKNREVKIESRVIVKTKFPNIFFFNYNILEVLLRIRI